MKNVLILGANGQIARIVEQRLLAEQPDTHLTLYLRNASRLDFLKDNPRVTIVDGDIHNTTILNQAMKGQDIVYISNVDHDADTAETKDVIEAMKANGVKRVIATNVLGIYDEVGGEFGRWNAGVIGAAGLESAANADRLLERSGLTWTTMRLPWLNDRDEVKYKLTEKGQPFDGVSGSRQSIADVVVGIIKDPEFLADQSVGIADPSTQGRTRPLY